MEVEQAGPQPRVVTHATAVRCSFPYRLVPGMTGAVADRGGPDTRNDTASRIAQIGRCGDGRRLPPSAWRGPLNLLRNQ